MTRHKQQDKGGDTPSSASAALLQRLSQESALVEQRHAKQKVVDLRLALGTTYLLYLSSEPYVALVFTIPRVSILASRLSKAK